MLVVLALAAAAVLVGVVVVAVGRGGQLADFPPDYPPLGLPTRRTIAGTDVALLRLPTSLWGYNPRATEEALRRIAHALTERETRIAVLEQQCADLRQRVAARTAGGPAPRPGGTAEPRPDRVSASDAAAGTPAGTGPAGHPAPGPSSRPTASPPPRRQAAEPPDHPEHPYGQASGGDRGRVAPPRPQEPARPDATTDRSAVDAPPRQGRKTDR